MPLLSDVSLEFSSVDTAIVIYKFKQDNTLSNRVGMLFAMKKMKGINCFRFHKQFII